MIGLAGTAAAQPQFPYTIVDLGSPGVVFEPAGIEQNTGRPAINEFNQVVLPRLDSNTVVRPTLWLPAPAYGLSAGFHDLISLFSITGYSSGAAFGINNSGIVVGQLGGTSQFDHQSRAVWWDLTKVGTTDPDRFRIIEPDPMNAGTPVPNGGTSRDWTRAMSVSERLPDGTFYVLVEAFEEDECFSTCDVGQKYSFAEQHIVISTASEVGVPLVADLCWPSAGTRAIAALPTGGDPDVFGTGHSGSYQAQKLCNDPITPEVNGLYWGTSNFLLNDFDSDPQVEKLFAAGRDMNAVGSVVGEAVRSVQSGSGAFFDKLSAIHWQDDVAFPYLLHDDIVPDVLFAQSVAYGLSDPFGGIGFATGEGGDEFLGATLLWRGAGSAWTGWAMELFGRVDSDSCPFHTPTAGLDVSSHGWIVAVGARFDPELPPGDRVLLLVPAMPWSCAADTNFDRIVDFRDLLEILGTYGGVLGQTGPCEYDALRWVDIDGSGEIDFNDILLVLASWTMPGDDCTMTGGGPPQSVEDCWERYGQDIAAFEACVNSLESSQ